MISNPSAPANLIDLELLYPQVRRIDPMSAVTPLPKDKSASEVHGIYDALSKKFGNLPIAKGLREFREPLKQVSEHLPI